MGGLVKREFGYGLRYTIAGISGNLLVLGLHLALTFGVGFSPSYAFSLACLVVFPISFMLSRQWTFRSDAAIWPALIMFAIGYMGSFLLQMAILLLGTNVLGAPHQYVVPTGQASAVVFFFLLQRVWIFGQRREHP